MRGTVRHAGLIDIHVHLYNRTNPPPGAQDESVNPDAFSFRSGVTTMVDAGSSGWKDFADFRDHIIKKARTRVLAFLNIVGVGMGTGKENDPAEMDAEGAARVAKENPDLIVGFKSAHYAGPGWASVEGAVKAGNATGTAGDGRLRPDHEGPQHRHAVSRQAAPRRYLHALLLRTSRGGAGERNAESGDGGRAEAQDHFRYRLRAGQLLLVRGGAGLRGGLPAGFDLDRPAHQQHERRHEELLQRDVRHHGAGLAAGGRGPHGDVGAGAGDPPAATGEPGRWAPRRTSRYSGWRRASSGISIRAGARMAGTQRMLCEMTLRKGQVAWDLNGLASEDWQKFRYRKGPFFKK